MTEKTRAPLLKVSTLGTFSVEVDGDNLSEDSRRQQQIWTLFKYIMIHRRRRIPPEEFYDILWRDEACENPSKALQNLIYRLRRVLSRDQKDAPNYILLKQGCYCWNPDAPAEIDVDQLEQLNQEAQACEQAGENERAVALYRECLALCKGNYLSENASQEWIVPTANYYKRLYITITTRLTQLLRTMERHEEILAVCEAAFRLEPYEEPLHAAFIMALLALGKPKQARTHYEYITSALYREYGVKPAQVLKDTYRYITENSAAVNVDLDVLQELLTEKEDNAQAFLCEPDLFRSIYKLEARRALRSGQVAYLVLFTLVPSSHNAPDPAVMTAAMDELSTLLLSSLRRGDVVSRWNESQFVIMLTSLTYEDGEKVVTRLQNSFSKRMTTGALMLKHKLQPLRAIF